MRVGQVASLITQKLNVMIKSEDWRLIRSKRKAVTALLPYAVRKERDGQPEMLDTFLQAAIASRDRDFTWRHIGQYASGIPHETTPRAIVLVLPHIYWGRLTDREALIQRWAAAASEVPRIDEVPQCVVNTLLQIASQRELLSHIPADAWLRLTERPSLPPNCRGRDVGTRTHVVRAVRALKNIEILKSYLLLVWSEWNYFPSDSFGNVSNHGLPAPRPLCIPDRRVNLSLSNSSERGSSTLLPPSGDNR